MSTFFQPVPGMQISIGEINYVVAEHPALPGYVYGMEGRTATVYQLKAGRSIYALKVFKPRYRLPEMVSLAEQMAPFAGMEGLQVCQRTVLNPQRHSGLLREHSDLTYAILMPWVSGPIWTQILLDQQALTPDQALLSARSFARVMADIEQHRLAHCDLSGANLVLPVLEAPSQDDLWRPTVALVDMEGLYGPNMQRPEVVSCSTPGYSHKTAAKGLWASAADRFAGAVLLAEILGWCDSEIRENACGETYFDAQEMQQDSERYRRLTAVLGRLWGEGVSRLFTQAWNSETLADCATFGEWMVTLPERVPAFTRPLEVAEKPKRKDDGGEVSTNYAVMQALIEAAHRLESQGNKAGALENYRQALALAPVQSGLIDELKILMEKLERGAAGGETSSSVEEKELAQLFDQGWTAYQAEHWAEAVELLMEVVRRNPDYRRNDRWARDLLAEARRRRTKRALPIWIFAVAGGGLVGVVGLVILFFIWWGGGGGGLASAPPTAFATAIVTPQSARNLEGGSGASGNEGGHNVSATREPQPVSTSTEKATVESERRTATPEAVVTRAEPTFEWIKFGRSVQNRDLSAAVAGYSGETAIVVVGSIQGDQESTQTLINDLISYYGRNLDSIPRNVVFYFIPSINPDGNADNSRFNAHGVDINRNWDTRDWRSDPAVPGYQNGKAGAGGNRPFSEPETEALRDLLNDIESRSSKIRVIILHSSTRVSSGEVYPGGSRSEDLAQLYSDATRYRVEYQWAQYVTSGEAVTWCNDEGMWAVDVVIPASQGSFSEVYGGYTLLDVTVNGLEAIGR